MEPYPVQPLERPVELEDLAAVEAVEDLAAVELEDLAQRQRLGRQLSSAAQPLELPVVGSSSNSRRLRRLVSNAAAQRQRQQFPEPRCHGPRSHPRFRSN